MFDHLLASRAKVQRMQQSVVDGQTTSYSWVDQEGILANFPCRLDLAFVRPGKDQLPAFEAGVAVARFGVLFCNGTVPLQAGDRIVALTGPIQGTFEIRNIPDRAQDFATAHHIEVQVIEVDKTIDDSGDDTFPSMDALPEATPDI